MRLCILADTIATDVTQISLKDGHIPSIRGHEHQGRNGVNDFLVEPSVWFKVLVVDVVVVNCVQRQLSWEMVSSPENDDEGNCAGQLDDFCLLRTVDDNNTRSGSGVRGSIIRRPKAVAEPEAMSAEDSFDLDEVFDSLPGLVSDYERSAITSAQFHDSLMKLLHLYILPSIVLTSRHTASMRVGLRQQERFLQKINDDIEGTSRKLEAVTHSKTKLRRRFIPDITSSNGDLRYSRSLVVTLLNDINDEILDASKDLEVAQDDVDRTKRKLETVKDSTVDDLAAARISRDQVVQNYEALLTARENIVATKTAAETMTIGRRHLLRIQRKSDKPEHKIYEELTTIQDELVRVMHSLAEKKLLSLSVKEAMKLTLAELETGADSCGVDVETIGYLKGGSDATDNGSAAATGGGGSLWMTLAEQVAEIMANANHCVTKQHRKFCTSVAERCKAAIGERIIYETMRQLSGDDKPSSSSSSSSGTGTTSSVVKGNGRSSSGSNRITTSNSIFYDDENLSPDCCRVVVPEEAELNGNNHPPPSSHGTRGGNGGGGGGLGIFRKSKRRSRPTSSESNRSTGSRKSTTLYMLASSADDDTVIVYEENKNYAKKAIKTLQDDITNHFEDVTEQLRVELRQKSITSLWLSYEPHFYDETIEHILTLYAIEYGAVTRTLGQTIRSLSASDLSFDDSILVRMLQETTDGPVIVYDRTADDGTPQPSPDHARSDVQPSSRTKADVGMCESGMDENPDNDTPLKRLSSAANPDVNVEDFLPRLRQISDGEAVNLTDLKTSSHSSKARLRKASLSEPFSVTIRKSIRIAHPFSTVIVYDRTICSDNNNPAAASETVNSSFRGVASNPFRKAKQEPPRPVRTMQMNAEYRRQFQQAFDFINAAVETQCPTTKFQQLAKCLRETSRQISIFCETVRGSTAVATCCDELMDGVILLLCNLDESVLSQLHIQILMLSDLIPPFFQSNSFSFTLVQFIAAFQFLKDAILMRKQPTSPSSRP